MIVLDTHVWVWWVSGAEPLPRKVKTALDQHRKDGTIRVSSISVWEVAQLVARGRLKLTMDVEDWIAKSEVIPFLGFVPVDNRIAVRSTRLPGTLHSDPADRIIIATALEHRLVVLTPDTLITRYPDVETEWT